MRLEIILQVKNNVSQLPCVKSALGQYTRHTFLRLQRTHYAWYQQDITSRRQDDPHTANFIVIGGRTRNGDRGNSCAVVVQILIGVA